MEKTNKKNALQIKAELIDFLLRHNSYELIINEAPFLRGNRWADLLLVSGTYLIGFEIKSELDSLKALNEQITDYSKVFNEVYVVLANKFYNKPEIKKIPTRVGIFVIDGDNRFTLKRKAYPRLSLDKSSLISILWRRDLESLARKQGSQDMEDLRRYVLTRCSAKDIQMHAVRALMRRYEESYKMFLKDRGTYTTVEDLRTITGLKKTHVF